MADFDKPVVGDTYVNWATLIKNAFQALAKMDFESQGDTNLDDGALQYNRTDKAFEQLASGVWSPLELSGANLLRSEILPVSVVAWPAGTAGSARASMKLANQDFYKYRFPRAYKLTHLMLAPQYNSTTDPTVSGGTATATIYKNGSTTSQSITINSTDSTHKYAAITSVSFAAGDYLEVYSSTSGLTLSNATNLVLSLIGKFTE